MRFVAALGVIFHAELSQQFAAQGRDLCIGAVTRVRTVNGHNALDGWRRLGVSLPRTITRSERYSASSTSWVTSRIVVGS